MLTNLLHFIYLKYSCNHRCHCNPFLFVLFTVTEVIYLKFWSCQVTFMPWNSSVFPLYIEWSICFNIAFRAHHDLAFTFFFFFCQLHLHLNLVSINPKLLVAPYVAYAFFSFHAFVLLHFLAGTSPLLFTSLAPN